MMMDEVRDVRVAVPSVDPLFVDFVTPERVIEPAEEKMWCTPLIYDGDDTAFTMVDGQQGKFGHHVILLASSGPEAIGETYDCTRMSGFDPLAIPVDSMPEGHGTFLKKGQKVVIQMHYVNTSEQPIRVRDVIRLKKKPVSEVTTWAAAYATNQAGFMVPPRAQGVKVSFDCAMPADVKLLVVGGHMHEQGASFKTEIGPDADHLERLYGVESWKADYRDAPPVTLMTSDPKPIAKGTVIRTTCEWNNGTDRILQYPDEMCSTFMLLAGIKEASTCWDDTAK